MDGSSCRASSYLLAVSAMSSPRVLDYISKEFICFWIIVGKTLLSLQNYFGRKVYEADDIIWARCLF